MSDNSEYKAKDELLRYLKNEMEPEERYRFERNLEKDPFELEAMEGFAEYSWNEIGNDLNNLQGNFTKRNSRRLVFVLSTAASLLIVVAASFLFLKQEKTDLEVVQDVLEEQVLQKADTVEMADDIVVDEDALEDKEQTIEQEVDLVAVKEEFEEILQPKVSVSKSEEVNNAGGAVKRARKIEQPKVEGVEIPEPELAIEAQKSKALTARVVKKKEDPQITIRGISANTNKKSDFVVGLVKDAMTKEPIPGVSVMIKGSSTGTVTNIDGFYRLDLPDTSTYNLIASFIGMNAIEFTSDEPVKELEMTVSDIAMDEVVVVGYGTQRKEEVVSAVTSVPAEVKINRRKTEPEIGWGAYREYLKTSVIYPSDSIATGKREVVRLDFIVYADGKVGSFNILKSPGESYSKEAIRLIEAGGIWIPEIKDGNTISKKVELRIVFRPEE